MQNDSLSDVTWCCRRCDGTSTRPHPPGATGWCPPPGSCSRWRRTDLGQWAAEGTDRNPHHNQTWRRLPEFPDPASLKLQRHKTKLWNYFLRWQIHLNKAHIQCSSSAVQLIKCSEPKGIQFLCELINNICCMDTNIKSEKKKRRGYIQLWVDIYTAPKLRIFYACIPLTYGPDNNANTDITACHVWSIEDNNLRLFYHHLFPYCL